MSSDLKLELVKYKNRKLYCKDLTRYVNLSEVIEFIQDGGVITVNTKDGISVTNDILKQCLLKTNASNEQLVNLIRS